jgi:hypothetical protein
MDMVRQPSLAAQGRSRTLEQPRRRVGVAVADELLFALHLLR